MRPKKSELSELLYMEMIKSGTIRLASDGTRTRTRTYTVYLYNVQCSNRTTRVGWQAEAEVLVTNSRSRV